MQYRTFGRTGLKVSEIGFGAWGIGGGWGRQDDAEAVHALQTAFDLGVNFYDTAYAYGDGHSERLIAKALGGKRDKLVIASKVPPKTFNWPATDKDPIETTFPADWIIQCTERTLKNLGADCLDIQQLHTWAEAYLREDAWYDALTKLRKQGKIRFFGISANDWDPYNSVSLIESDKIDSVQVIYNLFEQRPEEKLLPAALTHKVGIIVRVPFEEGLLTGKYLPGHKFDEDDWRAEWMTDERLKEAQPRLAALERELGGPYKDLPTLALKFVLAHPAVSTVIPGMRTVRHVQTNTAASDLPGLSDAKVAQLRTHKWYHGWGYPWS